MVLNRQSVCLLTIATAMMASEGPWKDKSASEWTIDEASEVLSDSPWAKTVHPTMAETKNDGRQRSGIGRGVGIGLPGIGIGLPGGMGRTSPGGYPGGGYPGGGRPGGGYPGGPTSGPSHYEAPPVLRVRWESAQPIREAERVARETTAPPIDERHYAIAVYDIPDRMLDGDSRTLTDRLKKQAAIRRDGKKDLKPTSVEVLRRQGGQVVVYMFPRTTEITKKDKRVEFDARIEKLQLNQPFYIEEMYYQGKLEL